MSKQSKARASKRAFSRAEEVKAKAVEAEADGILTTGAMAAMLGISEGPLRTWKSQGAPCLTEFFPSSCPQGGGQLGTGWKPDELRTWLKKEGRMDESGVLVSRQSGKRLSTPEQKAARKKAKGLARRRATKLAAAPAMNQARGGLLTTQEMADLLNVTTSRLHRWADQCGAPHIKHHFPPTKLPGAATSDGQWGNAWYPDKVIAWLKKSSRMDENGNLVEPLQGRKANEDPGWSGPDPELSARIVPVALPHLLGAFAHACQGGGIPVGLQNKLANAGLEELRPSALKMIEEMARKHQRTEAQWVLIKESLPALMGKRKREKKGVPTDE